MLVLKPEGQGQWYKWWQESEDQRMAVAGLRWTVACLRSRAIGRCINFCRHITISLAKFRIVQGNPRHLWLTNHNCAFFSISLISTEQYYAFSQLSYQIFRDDIWSNQINALFVFLRFKQNACTFLMRKWQCWLQIVVGNPCYPLFRCILMFFFIFFVAKRLIFPALKTNSFRPNI